MILKAKHLNIINNSFTQTELSIVVNGDLKLIHETQICGKLIDAIEVPMFPM